MHTPLPIHFFTIVLNGMPFIRHHIEVFKQLPFAWHWHIVEGVADLKHCTAWSLQNGAYIDSTFHRAGLSCDGTREYLDQLKSAFPNQISLYRKPHGQFWDGKLEMVNAPLSNIREECLLWQLDADELWLLEHFVVAQHAFQHNPGKSSAFYYCYYYVDEKLIITTINTYGNHTDYEWLRTWRYKPGMHWAAHEPPRLCTHELGAVVDVGRKNPFSHSETAELGLVFHHYAYATEAQLRFKESYYGYPGAVQAWRRLCSATRFPLRLADHLPWVKDETLVDTAESQGVKGIAQKTSGVNQWVFQSSLRQAPTMVSNSAEPAVVSAAGRPTEIMIIRTDSIGDAVLSTSLIEPLSKKYPGSRITMVCQKKVAELFELSPSISRTITFDRNEVLQEPQALAKLCGEVRACNPEVVINALYSPELLTHALAQASGGKEIITLRGNTSNQTDETRTLTEKTYTRIIETDEDLTEIARYDKLLSELGITGQPVTPKLWLSPSDEDFASRVIQEHHLNPAALIALCPGSQWQYKQYHQYGHALSLVSELNNFTVLGLGDQKDSGPCINASLCTTQPLLNLCGKLTLRQSAALLKRCRLALCADSALAHIACAAGIPHVVLLGGGHFGRFFPYSALTSTVCRPLPCYGCNWNCTYDRVHCVEDISPTVIAEAIRQTLLSSSPRPRVFVDRTRMATFESRLPVIDPPAIASIRNSEVIPVYR